MVTMGMVAVVLAVVVLAAFVVLRRRAAKSPETWRDRGEPRGRTKAEPEGTLHIKVIRADGTVEDHGVVPAQVTRRR